MLIGLSFAGVPSSVTLPLTEPAVAVSTVAPPAGADVAAGCDDGDSLCLPPPQPEMANATAAARTRFTNLIFMLKFFLLSKRRILTILAHKRASSFRRLQRSPVAGASPSGWPAD